MKKFNLDTIIRPNIKNLNAYASARDEFKGQAEVYLDANENPFGQYNRYPDPKQKAIKKRLSILKNTKENQIFVGNGSDEVIDLAFRIFCKPNIDKALTFSPSYGMYKVSAEINDITLIEVPLTKEFQINTNQLDTYLKDETLKLIFICSPNNPTGNCFEAVSIAYIIENFTGVVIIDEAYIDFSSKESYITALDRYPNLIISQTFSKAWGLAGVRVGVAYAKQNIIDLYNKVKPPYNVSSINQKEVCNALDNILLFEENKALILEEKKRLIEDLEKNPFVKKIYPSEANFLLVEVDNAIKAYQMLIEKQIIVRNRNHVIQNCIRITVGSRSENEKLITELKKLSLKLV